MSVKVTVQTRKLGTPSVRPVAAGRSGEAKGGMRYCAGAAFGGEFGNSASGELALALQNGFGRFVSRQQ